MHGKHKLCKFCFLFVYLFGWLYKLECCSWRKLEELLWCALSSLYRKLSNLLCIGRNLAFTLDIFENRVNTACWVLSKSLLLLHTQLNLNFSRMRDRDDQELLAMVLSPLSESMCSAKKGGQFVKSRRLQDKTIQLILCLDRTSALKLDRKNYEYPHNIALKTKVERRRNFV